MRTEKSKDKLAKQTFSEAVAPGENSRIGMRKTSTDLWIITVFLYKVTMTILTTLV